MEVTQQLTGACESPVQCPLGRDYLVSLGLLESLEEGFPQEERRRKKRVFKRKKWETVG